MCRNIIQCSECKFIKHYCIITVREFMTRRQTYTLQLVIIVIETDKKTELYTEKTAFATGKAAATQEPEQEEQHHSEWARTTGIIPLARGGLPMHVQKERITLTTKNCLKINPFPLYVVCVKLLWQPITCYIEQCGPLNQTHCTRI